MANMSSGSSSVARRSAVQGIAGSLAGIAALGAVGASAKKKKKSSKKGTLVRVKIAEQTETIPVLSIDEVEALCDAPGSKENVFVLGGGFESDPATSEFFVIKSSAPTTSGGEQGWVIAAENTDNMTEIDVTAFAICGYFRKK